MKNSRIVLVALVAAALAAAGFTVASTQSAKVADCCAAGQSCCDTGSACCK